MFVGRLNSRIEILGYEFQGNKYFWEAEKSVWANVTEDQKINIFSNVAKSGFSTVFTVRTQGVTPGRAIMWQDRHYIIAGIREIDKLYTEISTVCLPVYDCTRYIPDPDTASDEYNRLQTLSIPDFQFQGCIAEKYLGNEISQPHTIDETQYVLLTPKAVVLNRGELVLIGEDFYIVEICHMLDTVKNEYEISRRGDR